MWILKLFYLSHTPELLATLRSKLGRGLSH